MGTGSTDPRALAALRLRQRLVLAAGAAAGGVLACLAAGIDLDLQGDLDQARALGISSRTILAGYSKARDVYQYVLLVGLPVGCALLGWLAFSRGRRPALAAAIRGEDHSAGDARGLGTRPGAGVLLALVLFGLLATFNVNSFHRPAFNPAVGAWPLLGEEGEMLEWAARILRGEVYGRDFFCLYGPMLIYPLSGFLDLFGSNVVVARVYGHLLNLAGYGIVLFWLQRTMKHTSTFVCAGVLYLLAFNMLLTFSPNTSPLRFVAGLLPLMLVHLPRGGSSPSLVAAAGVAAGQSLLFSQEAGVCGVIAVAVYLGLEPLGRLFAPGSRGPVAGAAIRPDWPRAARSFGVFLGACVLSLLPFLTYLAAHGAVAAFFETLLGYPRLVTLGYGALPFPSLREFLARPLAGEHVFFYWVIGVYIAALLAEGPRALLGLSGSSARMRLATAVYGLLLYRIVLGRSDEFNVFKASLPAFLLCFWYAEAAIARAVASRRGRPRAIALVRVIAWVGSLVLVLVYSPMLSSKIVHAASDLMHPVAKFTLRPGGLALPELPRLGVRVDPDTASDLREIDAFLREETREGEPVYFFPNEAVYYFVFDRPNPTRFAISYFAVTRAHREELIADLGEKAPRVVVASLGTWRVDDISANVQVPEVLEYLAEDYDVVRQTPRLVFLERKPLR